MTLLKIVFTTEQILDRSKSAFFWFFAADYTLDEGRRRKGKIPSRTLELKYYNFIIACYSDFCSNIYIAREVSVNLKQRKS